MRDLLWIILTEEGDFDGCEHGATPEDAIRTLYGEGHDETAQVILVTPEIRHGWALARRRERHAERREAGTIKSRARAAPAGFVFDLSMGASMAIHDPETGRCRCPSCGRYSIPADFAKAPTSARFRTPSGVACVTFGPACWRCRGLERAPYDLTPEVTDG